MSSSSSAKLTESIGHGFAALRAKLHGGQGGQVQVGVVAWDSDSRWFDVRVVHEDERVQGLHASTREYAELVAEELRQWGAERRVPYATTSLEPWSADFWVACSRILRSAIELDKPRAMNPMHDNKTQLEDLFQAVVQPRIVGPRGQRRVDGLVTQALGLSAGYFERRSEIGAFRGARETVLRHATGANGRLVVEAVNLATSTARHDADALVSRLLRILSAHARTRFVVGYVASSEGLNGETHMKEWIKEQVTPAVFDLVVERERFRQAAVAGLADVGVPLPDAPPSLDL